MVAADDGTVRVRVEQAPARHDDVERTVAAVVGRHLGRDQRLHRVVHRRAGDEGRRVHRPPRLGRRVREVEGRLVAADQDPHAHTEGPIVHAVVVEPVLAFPHPVGQGTEGRAHLGLGRGMERVEAGLERVGAVPRDQLAEAPGRDVVGGVLGEDVALALVAAADIREQEVELLPVGAGGREEADGRDAHPLLIALGRPRHVAAGHGAADVGPVGEVDGEGEEPAAREHGSDRLHVRQVVAADLGQVEEPDVALLQALGRHALEQLLDSERHDPEVDRDVPSLGDEAPPGVGQRGREVARFLQER